MPLHRPSMSAVPPKGFVPVSARVSGVVVGTVPLLPLIPLPVIGVEPEVLSVSCVEVVVVFPTVVKVMDAMI